MIKTSRRAPILRFTQDKPCGRLIFVSLAWMLLDGLTAKLTGGNGAQRNCRPVQRLVRRIGPISCYNQDELYIRPCSTSLR